VLPWIPAVNRAAGAFYLLIRYGLGEHLISGTDFAIGTIIGIATIGAFLTVGPTVLFPRIMKR
jgi:hypothetical protein